jgi:hypothetical protein
VPEARDQPANDFTAGGDLRQAGSQRIAAGQQLGQRSDDTLRGRIAQGWFGAAAAGISLRGSARMERCPSPESATLQAKILNARKLITKVRRNFTSRLLETIVEVY